MEPLTHFLTGACIGRAGFNRKTAYATLAAVLAAEAADLDVLWGLAGPVEELKHHRGITHTFVAVPVVAGVVVGAIWLFDRWRKHGFPPLRHEACARVEHPRLSASRETPAGVTQRVGWWWLFLTAVVAALSHLLLDWTNNYGVRPFYPFNPRWYAGSFMFIAEPVVWGILSLALIMPWVLGLADREIGVRKQPYRGRGWAIFALAAFALLMVWRWNEHGEALTMITRMQVTSEPVVRMAAEPYPVNPYHWHAILETRDYYQTAEVNTWNPSSLDAVVSDPHANVMYKPTVTPAVQAAKQTLLGRVYLDWGRWAVVSDVGQKPEAALAPPELPKGETWTTVTFNDLRFDYSFLAMRSDRAPLSGWVYIVNGHDEAGEGMGGEVQK